MDKVRVAAGVLRRADGQILLAQRPEGKIAAGRWEFPGGKIEPGETAEQALKRELQEEIGIVIEQARPLLRLTHAYSERIVELDTWLISQWSGEPEGLEQQALSWCDAGQTEAFDILEADKPILDALQLPVELPVTGRFDSSDQLLTRAQKIFRRGHRLLRLRAPQLDDVDYQRCFVALAELAHECQSQILADRLCCSMEIEGCAGLHLRADELPRLRERPCPESKWLFASVHSLDELEKAQTLGANAVVLGHVQATESHPQQAPMGWTAFTQLVAHANLPVYAIGGLGSADLSTAWQAGAQGIAGISAYW